MPDHDTIQIGIDTRHVLWFDPAAGTPDPLPLILGFHGGGSNALAFAATLGLASGSLVDAAVVLLQGWGAPDLSAGAWNSGHSTAGLQVGRDDLAFADAVVAAALTRATTAGRRIDLSRIHAIGFSNGGMMCYRLAAERSDTFSSVTVMSAAIGGDPDPANPALPIHVNDPAVHDAAPVSIQHVHGLADTGAPFLGGPTQHPGRTRADVPVPDGIDMWVRHNGCEPVADVGAHPLGVLRQWRAGTDDGAEVALVTMPGVGHDVPDGALGAATDFVVAHPR